MQQVAKLPCDKIVSLPDVFTGAREVIEQTVARPIVTNLSLSHHKLRDEGVVALLGHLSFSAGGKYKDRITHIDLGDNSCGDKSLEAISSYLLNNKKLKKLLLQKVCIPDELSEIV